MILLHVHILVSRDVSEEGTVQTHRGALMLARLIGWEYVLGDEETRSAAYTLLHIDGSDPWRVHETPEDIQAQVARIIEEQQRTQRRRALVGGM